MTQYSLIFGEYLIFCIFPYKRTPDDVMKSLRICFIIWVQVKGTHVRSLKYGSVGFKLLEHTSVW